MDNFGERLRLVRHFRRMTQEELAESIGVSRTAVSNWETGFAHPSVDVLIPIKKALNVNLDYLLGLKDIDPFS